MGTKIKFLVNEETKCLTQQMVEQERKILSHDAWVAEQVNLSFEKYDSGKAVFVDNESAKSQIKARKAIIRN